MSILTAIAGYTLLTNKASLEAFLVEKIFNTAQMTGGVPKSYPVYVKVNELADFPDLEYLYPHDLNQLVAGMAEATKERLGVPELAGWIVSHPLTDKPVHVVTAERWEADRNSAEAVLALATSGDIQLKVASNGTVEGTKITDMLSGRELTGVSSVVVVSPLSADQTLHAVITVPLHGIEITAPVYRANSPDVPPTLRIYGDAEKIGPLIGIELSEYDPQDRDEEPLGPVFWKFALPGYIIPHDPAEMGGEYDRRWYQPEGANVRDLNKPVLLVMAMTPDVYQNAENAAPTA